MSSQFREMPLAFRLSQGGIGGAFSLALVTGKLFNPIVPRAVQFLFVAILSSLVLLGFIFSLITLLKFPYLSLLEIENDYFSRYFNPRNSIIYRAIGLLAVFAIVLNLGVNWSNLNFSDHTGFAILYLALLIPFLVFLVFVFSNDSYPTIATYIQSTVGVGLLLFPFYLPILVFAGLRCRRLLAEADRQIAG